MGQIYYFGDGVPQDYIQAHRWFNISSANGNPEAENLRNTVSKEMTPEQIAEAQKLAKEWFEKHPTN
jgi:uncharacterized protein